MDIQKYIASGILELYVLGQTSEEESKEVEQMMAQYPEIKEEVIAIEEALEKTAFLSAVNPDPATKAKLFDQLEEVPSSQNDKPSRRLINPLLTIAAILLAPVLAFAIFLLLKNNELKEELANKDKALANMEVSCDSIKTQNGRLNNYITQIRQEGTIPIALKGTEALPEAVAVVYWNDKLQKSFFDPSQLPPASSNQDYQLWAIVDGQPVDMGVLILDAPEKDLIEIPFIPNPSAFAITLEPKGGSEVPTLDQMVLIGNFG